MEYKYDKSDPRPNQRHYMYAEFGGSQFLYAYEASRRAALELLEASKEAKTSPQGQPPSSRSELTLPRVLQTWLSGRLSGGEELQLGQFLRRKIEIHHRLRAAYGVDGRMIDPADPGVEAYALSALLFLRISAQHQEVSQGLAWLNAALKANDVALFLVFNGQMREGSSTVAEAVRMEMKAVLNERERCGLAD